jgi:hypothetical protein
MTAREGGCSCGAVRYRLKTAPIIVHCCHCDNCQRQTGSAFVINAVIETANIERLSGEPEAVPVPRESAPHDIHRCPRCHVAVWSDYGRRPGVRFVRVGTLDDAHALAPDVHIFTRAKVPWVRLPEGVPAFPEFYEPKTLWTDEQRRRWRAAVP